MPELPEVELVAKSLGKLVGGRTIIASELLRDRLAPDSIPAEFVRKLKDSQIKSVSRRGKHILFELSNLNTLIVHLRMSGRFMLLPIERELPKFTHAIFYFEDESRLIFNDQRHFGFMKIVETASLDQAKEIRKLAPEPFSAEFSTKYFRDALASSARTIKELLLDQTKITGLGNIYAAEVLFLARVNPEVPANRVSAIKANRLHRFVKEVLAESIENGSTINVDPENIDGGFYDGGFEGRWRVYDREGEPCINCDTKIRRIKQSGRSSYFCPKCQKRVNK